MSVPAIWFSDDQAEAWDTAAEVLRGAGVDVEESTTMPKAEGPGGVLAILGKAGTGKTMLLAKLAESLRDAGVEVITGDYDYRRRRDRRTIAILAPTNKAASFSGISWIRIRDGKFHEGWQSSNIADVIRNLPQSEPPA